MKPLFTICSRFHCVGMVSVCGTDEVRACSYKIRYFLFGEIWLILGGVTSFKMYTNIFYLAWFVLPYARNWTLKLLGKLIFEFFMWKKELEMELYIIATKWKKEKKNVGVDTKFSWFFYRIKTLTEKEIFRMNTLNVLIYVCILLKTFDTQTVTVLSQYSMKIYATNKTLHFKVYRE